MKKIVTTILFVIIGILTSQKASAQLINLKTAPVASGDQFMVTPSISVGLGGLSIALDDTLADPFVNPAKTGRVQGINLYMLPMFYRINDGNGAAKTLSLGGLTGGNWFGGGGIAVQEMDPGGEESNLLRDQSANNNYVWLQAGKRLDRSTTMGIQFSWSGLQAMGGVALLYPNENINQHGHQLDVRMGLDRKTSQRGNFEILTLFHRSDMRYEFEYRPITCPACLGLDAANFVPGPNTLIAPPEVNKDITNTWGLHLGYDQPIGSEGWKLGGVATLNYKTHPKIPNYELMNIPRDPGNSWAFNFGLGTSHLSDDHITFGTDVILEPIWSTTWAKSPEDIISPDGTILLQQGKKTVKNRFSFLNSIIKTGLGWQGQWMLWQLGIQAKTYRYVLKQQNYVQNNYRHQKEHWTEWTFSWSLGAHFNRVKIAYIGLFTTGVGQPGVSRPIAFNDLASSTGSGNFIFAPDGRLQLDNSSVLTNQIVVTIAL